MKTVSFKTMKKKLKPRLRHFWRNNKKCIGMYLTFYCIAMAILALCLGGYKDAFNNIMLALVWSIVWLYNRELNIAKRVLKIQEHRIHKTYKRGIYKGIDIALETLKEHNDGKTT